MQGQFNPSYALILPLFVIKVMFVLLAAYISSYGYTWEFEKHYRLQSELPRFEPWPGTLCCVLGLMVPLSTQVYNGHHQI